MVKFTLVDAHYFGAFFFRITADLACRMNLARYPLDEQNCLLEIESCEMQ